MGKKIVVVGLCVILGLIALMLVLNPNAKKSLTNPLITNPQPQAVEPSETLKDYSDPAGFSFTYPDNLSLTKQETVDNSTYADLLVSSKDVSGSLSLKITDSKFKSINDWLKLNQAAALEKPEEVKLGTLPAIQLKLKDRLLLGALDQGIFFNIEMPLVEENFWTKVYGKILAGFSFAPPTAASNTTSDTDDVSFEGEEVVE